VGGTTTAVRGDPVGELLRVLRWLLVAAGAVAVVPVVATLVLRQVDVTSPHIVAYVAGTPLVLAAGVASMLLFALARSGLGAAVAGVLTAVLALTQVPLYLGTASAASGATPLTVLTINLHYGSGDAAAIVDTVRAEGVDVLATEELTKPAVDALRAAGIDDVLPYATLNPGGAQHGNGLWTSAPLTSSPVPSGFDHPPVAATMAVAGRTMLVACVHPISPYPDDTAEWDAEMGLLQGWLAGVDSPAIFAGDFNATPDHRQFRDVLATGFADAATQVGTGWLPTYPANRRRLPLLITIDHVLTNDGIVATSVARVNIPDTDHVGLLVRLAVPPA